MNILLKTTLLTSAVASISVTAGITFSGINRVASNNGGIVEAMCKVKSSGSTSISPLVIDETNTPQDVGTLDVWCNTGRSATTKYSSSNNGFLVDGANKIGYTLDVGNSANEIDLASDYTSSEIDASTDSKGASKPHALKITLNSADVDYASEYSDTITVTVSYN
jgi:hypothetical protein